MKLLNTEDYRVLAKERLPKGLYEYIARGTEDEVALRAMYSALESIRLPQRILRDVSTVNTAVDVFGLTQSMPAIVAPTAVAGLMCYDGETQLACAARDAGVPFCVSTQSMTAIEAIADRAPGARLWFQVYVFENRTLTRQIIERAANVGVDTLVLTVDTPRSPKKEWNLRNGFGVPVRGSLAGAIDILAHPRWSTSVLLRYLANGGIPNYAHYPSSHRTNFAQSAPREVNLAASLTWNDVVELRRHWKGKLVIKGILDVEDARLAVSYGCDGIVVSSHGGRNFDSAPTVVEMLPVIADAVGDRSTVFADSGVRRGSDIVKYMSLGAKAVFCGRAPLYGVAVAGAKGARDVLRILRQEMEHCLAFSGTADANAVVPISRPQFHGDLRHGL